MRLKTGEELRGNFTNKRFDYVRCRTAQDRGPFWFSYFLNEILQYIKIWNEFKV